MTTPRVRIKICCIASRDEAAMAIDAGADALGLVGPMPSGPGVIDEDAIRDIAGSVPPGIATFLLTSRVDADAIDEHVRGAGVNTVQVVTEIPPDESGRLRALLPRQVRYVQVVHVEDESAIERARGYEPYVDGFLLDSGRPSQPTPELGGTGRTHDWGVSARFVAATEKPVFLAGGLAPSNVSEAIRTVRPFGVDLCTGVRTRDRLDPAKLGPFVEAVRTA